MWLFDSGKGTFWIRFVPMGRGVFMLGVDETELGTYSSPETAADDVYLKRSGFAPWDEAEDAPGPPHLGQWTRLDCAAWDARSEPSENKI